MGYIPSLFNDELPPDTLKIDWVKREVWLNLYTAKVDWKFIAKFPDNNLHVYKKRHHFVYSRDAYGVNEEMANELVDKLDLLIVHDYRSHIPWYMPLAQVLKCEIDRHGHAKDGMRYEPQYFPKLADLKPYVPMLV